MANVTKAEDFAHPQSTADVVALVNEARGRGKKLRVRGSGHSVAAAIYTPGFSGDGPVPGGDVDVMLDRMRDVKITPSADGTSARVDVLAGCHLGKDPYDPTKSSTWKNSLNAQLQRAGFALSDLGGITHQTVGGFLATGSSGGSTTRSIDDDILGFEVVDGDGNVRTASRDSSDKEERDLFEALGVSMGLLGVITRVTLRAQPTYNLFGTQATTTVANSAIDFYGEGSGKPTFTEFLRGAPYSRLMWWPQRGFDRMAVWEVSRLEPTIGFTPQPYQELGRAPQLSSLAGCLFYTIIGNLDDVARIPEALAPWYAKLEETIEGDPDGDACCYPHARAPVTAEAVLAHLEQMLTTALANRGPRPPSPKEGLRGFIDELKQDIKGDLDQATGSVIAKIIVAAIRILISITFDVPWAQKFATWLKGELPDVIAAILDPFVPLGTIDFWDTWMCGLPMDNQMDDQLWPTWFTELWLPIEKAQDAMCALRDYYAGGGDPATSYDRTGAFSCELYAAKKSAFWMSPSYGTDVVRFDAFWFARNAGTPMDFYAGIWETLKPFGFRTHWGKILPPATPAWAEHYRKELPRMNDFLALRAKLDPAGTFLSTYWKQHLGIG